MPRRDRERKNERGRAGVFVGAVSSALTDKGLCTVEVLYVMDVMRSTSDDCYC